MIDVENRNAVHKSKKYSLSTVCGGTTMAIERVMTLEKLANEMKTNFQSFKNELGQLRIYVKPYTQEIREDLEMYRTMPYAQERMLVTEMDGTYMLTSVKSVETYADFLKMMHGELYLWWAKVRQYLGTPRDVVMEIGEESGVSMVRALWGRNNIGMKVEMDDFFKNYYPTRVSRYYIEPTQTPEFFQDAA